EAVMSDELLKMKHQEYVDRAMRQQLRNDCMELRVLAEQLRLAAITKELDELMEERHKSRQIARDAKVIGFQRAEAERLEQMQLEQQRELQKKEQQTKFHESLSKQIEEKKKKRNLQHIQKAAEREESIMRNQRFEEEVKAEQLELIRQKQYKLQSHLDHIQEKREYEERRSAMNAEYAARLEKEEVKRQEAQKEFEAAKRQARLQHEQISMKIGNHVLELETVKQKRNNLLLDLLQAEYKAKDDERHRQQLEQEQQERVRARQELELYRANMQERQLEDARLRQQQIVERSQQHVDNEDNADVCKERLRRKEHGAVLLAMIDQNNLKRAAEAAEHVQLFDAMAKIDAEKQNRIQEERMQMLSSVPAGVLQYLPKHTLSDADRKRF
ncbi:hypothetical protein KR093_005298, partial [Drosophila rubida]